MNRSRFDYAALPGRPLLRWPQGRRLAVWVVPNVEHYEFQPSHQGPRQPWPRSAPPDTLNYPLKEYGLRVGLDRFMDMSDRLGLRCTVSLSTAVPTMFPELFEEMRRRDWDFMCHGLYNTHYLWDYDLPLEREFVADCRRRMDEATGRNRHGWFSPACSHTFHTADLVEEAGFSYYCDLFHDDQPFPVLTPGGSLISLPYSMDVNDAVVHINGGEGEDFAQVILDQFQTLYRDSRRTGLVMCIACHPYLSAQPSRIAAFERALRHVMSHDDVWLCTGSEMESWYRSQHLDTMKSWLEESRAAPSA